MVIAQNHSEVEGTAKPPCATLGGAKTFGFGGRRSTTAAPGSHQDCAKNPPGFSMVTSNASNSNVSAAFPTLDGASEDDDAQS